MKLITTCVIAGLGFAASHSNAEDWPQFRGPQGNGLSAEDSAPLRWGQEVNVKWRTELPSPANGSPIVSNGRVFVTGSQDEGRERNLYCFDRETGEQLWVRTAKIDKVTQTHKQNPHGASSPAANGEVVVVWHGSAGLYCYDFAGEKLWSNDLGDFHHLWGYASSPVIHDGRVIVNCGPGKRVFLAAVDLASGETLWETDEPVAGDGQRNEQEHYIGSWSTPVITEVGGSEQIVCAFNTRVNGYDPATGKLLWHCDGIKGPKGELVYSSPHILDDLCVVIGGYKGPGIGFKLGGEGDVTPARLWRTLPNPQSIGSGVYAGGYLYLPDADQGTIHCIDPKTGEEMWREEAEGANHWGSIVMAAGRLYVTNQEGDTIVFAPNPKSLEKLAVNALGEESNSTPAISNGEIFLRTYEALYCIAE